MPQNLGKMPLVSVVMPVRNEADFIESGLRAVFAQIYPHDSLEIIIADGKSDDVTVEVIKNLQAETDIPIKIITNHKKIAPHGLNRSIAESNGEIIVRVDGHCEIAPDYIVNCVKYLRENKAECVGGPIETIGATLSARAISLAMSSNFGVGGSAFRCVQNREMYVDTVAFPAYRREIFEQIGLFNEELVRNQDDELNYRLRKSGGRILLAPDIRSKYYSRSSFKSLWRQYFQYGYWKIRVLQLHPKQMSLRQFVPFTFVLTIALLGFLSLFSTNGRWALTAVFGLYFLANLTATIKLARHIKISALPMVAPAFAVLHFSYAFGFCAGLFAFRQKWKSPETKDTATTAAL